jgi:GDP-L-fucose synthase
MSEHPRIYVAGHRGMVGAAILRQLQAQDYPDVQLITRSHTELDLTNQLAVRALFEQERPDQVYLAAAKVGGIHANNSRPAEFIYRNLMIEANVIHEAWRAGVRKLLFLGSSCIYPRLAEQPMREEALLTGPLEATNEPYAVAKIAGIKLCESYNRQSGTDYRSVMPTNLYGPGDHYDLENSHVIPAMIRKLHLAKLAAAGQWSAIEHDEARRGVIPDDLRELLQEIAAGRREPGIRLWGTGTPRREFLYVDDMAAACVHVMNLHRDEYAAHTEPMRSHLNIGTGEDLTIRDLALLVARVVGFTGGIEFDPARPDGTPRKLLDISRITALGWKPRTPLEQGLAEAYADYQSS